MANFMRLAANTPFSTASCASDGLYDHALREVLSECIRRSGQSRDQVADRMSSILRRRITRTMIDQWCAPGRATARIPACYVRAFSEATGTDLLDRFLLGGNRAELLRLGELVSRVVPSALSQLRKRKTASIADDQELLFG